MGCVSGFWIDFLEHVWPYTDRALSSDERPDRLVHTTCGRMKMVYVHALNVYNVFREIPRTKCQISALPSHPTGVNSRSGTLNELFGTIE